MKGYTVDDNGYLQAPPVEPPKYHAPIGLAILIASVVSTIIIVIMVGKNKMVMKATQAEEYIDSKSINISNKESAINYLLWSHPDVPYYIKDAKTIRDNMRVYSSARRLLPPQAVPPPSRREATAESPPIRNSSR